MRRAVLQTKRPKTREQQAKEDARKRRQAASRGQELNYDRQTVDWCVALLRQSSGLSDDDLCRGLQMTRGDIKEACERAAEADRLGLMPIADQPEQRELEL